MLFRCPFVLASGSPRRHDLLVRLGLTFERLVPDIDESVPPGIAPPAHVASLAAQKAAAISALRPEGLVLAADTVVAIDGEILNKPESADHAADMLRRLSGRTHEVFTGIALAHAATGRSVSAYEATRVTFASLEEREIAAYVASGAPLDKAGAYGIQDDRGALFVARIEGDYYNVVGLPLHRFYVLAKTAFSDLLIV
jgi:septum formation protein